MYYQLCGNIFLNRLDNCYAYQYALGDSNTTINIPEADFNQVSNIGAYSLDPEYATRELSLSQKYHSVQQIRLDNLPPPPRKSNISFH